MKILTLFLFQIFVCSAIACEWENLGTDRCTNFSKLNTVVISASLPKSQQGFFKSQLEKTVNGRAKLVFVDDVMENLSNILGAKLVLHFVYNTTDLPSIHLLQAYVTTQIEIQANQTTQNGVVWQKSYLFQDQNHSSDDVCSSIKESLELFMNQYFVNCERKEFKPTFYFFFNS